MHQWALRAGQAVAREEHLAHLVAIHRASEGEAAAAQGPAQAAAAPGYLSKTKRR
jgi:hypothetical protein